MSVPSSPLDRKAAIPHSPVVPSRPTTLQLQDYYPPNLSPLAAFASTPCTSLTPADAAVVLETALLWVRPDHSHAVVHAGALAMQNACARLLATDHGYLENLFSDANRLANNRDPTNFIDLNLRIVSLTLFTTRLRTIQQNIRDSCNHAVAGAPHVLRGISGKRLLGSSCCSLICRSLIRVLQLKWQLLVVLLRKRATEL